jgi:hypothetical protein
MNPALLMVLHIAVLGYWLGSDLVINSEFRFIVHRSGLPLAARDAMTDHLMKVDQHVRYALVLQAVLGTLLLAGSGLMSARYGPAALALGIGWLALVEAAHRWRKEPRGARLARLDRLVRYAVAGALLAAAWVQADWPGWLRFKLALFAGVIGCGVLIRFQLIRHFALWADILSDGSTPAREAALRVIYRRATAILALLWGLVLTIAALAVLRPF